MSSIVSNIAAWMKDYTHPSVFRASKTVYHSIFSPSKAKGEMDFWRMQYKREGNALNNKHYENIMLKMAQPLTRAYFNDKVVCDFGCGPRGSLTWLTDSAHCIGVDVLASEYLSEFPEVLRGNNMTYVTCSESHIPIQTGMVDVVITMNALDHVLDLRVMCEEIVRILKPGGYLIASFNLGEEATVTEPQTLDEEKLQSVILDRFTEVSKRIGPKVEGKGYSYLIGSEPIPDNYIGPEIMWFVGWKKS